MLRIKNLRVWYTSRNKSQKENTLAVDNVSLEISRGETLGLVGKSGSGKSTIAWAAMGMMDHIGGECTGEIYLHGDSLLNQPNAYRSILWKKIAMVPQAAMNSFNPVMKIGCSIKEVLKHHCPDLSSEERHIRCRELMELTQLPDEVLLYYPHQMSGGMKQRAALAKALACKPELLILDEATTGLDVLTEANLLKVVRRLQREENMSMMFISHDVRLVRSLCDRKIVLKDGKAVQDTDGYFKELIDNSYWILPKGETAYA
ncbi:dipeptide/oligopeptide/nickel ABC transporter ATP-binding protein [Desulfitibacter alkalitolerans]|uniref:ABC transporter ATP-binding protein n=1 Tax=Desulfitibacter alkalitolerans TaxID=264641 RepID=UPI000686E21E|nr:dipeptide/oligopeptide/nickel ABC transporter ATP-binding protein [Desulfitibacter alkalitolerans]